CATTAFANNFHYLKKFNNYNHVLQTSSAEVVRSIASIRDRAHKTNNQLTQIIQNTIINIPKEIYPYVPSQYAFSTLSREEFLVRDSVIENEQILLFTTKVNMQYLSRSLYWMMNSTFKTVLAIFCQLYTIHAPIGVGITQEALFQDLIKFAEENNILLRPATILTDLNLLQLMYHVLRFLTLTISVASFT
ncbi:22463_t:CDS:2, partial [Gigaspora margarita]